MSTTKCVCAVMLTRKEGALHQARVRHGAATAATEESQSAMLQRIGFARTAEPGTATRYWCPSAPVVTM
jgi:hypothetical protein